MPVSDGHNDLAILIRFGFQNNIYDKNFTDSWENGGMPAQVDLPRLKTGRAGGTFWSAVSYILGAVLSVAVSF